MISNFRMVMPSKTKQFYVLCKTREWIHAQLNGSLCQLCTGSMMSPWLLPPLVFHHFQSFVPGLFSGRRPVSAFFRILSKRFQLMRFCITKHSLLRSYSDWIWSRTCLSISCFSLSFWVLVGFRIMWDLGVSVSTSCIVTPNCHSTTGPSLLGTCFPTCFSVASLPVYIVTLFSSWPVDTLLCGSFAGNKIVRSP